MKSAAETGQIDTALARVLGDLSREAPLREFILSASPAKRWAPCAVIAVTSYRSPCAPLLQKVTDS